MGSGWGGVLTGALVLIVLEVVTKASGNSSSGASNVLSLLKYPGQLAANWMSPTTPLVPDLASTASTTSSTSSTSSAAGAATSLPLAIVTGGVA